MIDSGADGFDTPDRASALTPPRVSEADPASAVIKRVPEDFQVEEIPAVSPQGVGGHTWLHLERDDMTTAYAAKRVARVAGCAARDVGYAGLKDRHARTRQWFSVPATDDDAALHAALIEQGFHVLAVVRHSRKLRRGALAGNRFRIRVETGVDAHTLEPELERIRREGVPNYFGPQRFGRDGGNLDAARRMLCDGERVRDRHRRGLLLSAARSVLFNRVLAARVRDDSWQQPLPGEAVILDGSASFFIADQVDETLMARARDFDVHASGPLWGRGGTPAQERARIVENEALEHDALLCAALERAGVDAARRALRLRVGALAANAVPGGWEFRFELPAGAYATVVLRELFELREPGAQV